MTPEAKIEKRSSREVKGETIVLEKDNKVEYERKNFREIKTSPQ